MPPVWLAVDTDDVDRARDLIARCRPWLGGVKLGLEFFVAHGPAGVMAVMAGSGLPLFLDLKLHDIPNTVARAVESAQALGPTLLTIHASGGEAMVRAARVACPPETKLIAVSILTSLDDADLAAVGICGMPAEAVMRLALLARSAGADGLVCSPHEVADVAAGWPKGFFVVPGIRPAGSDEADQKRVLTPRQALAAGAGALVIGRPITAAPDPAAAARAIAEGLAA